MAAPAALAEFKGNVTAVETAPFWAEELDAIDKKREKVRQMHAEAKVPFMEVFVDVPLEVAESRDPKGLYRKARAGEIKDFTGVHQPYEAPAACELTLPAATQSVDACALQVVQMLRDRHVV